LLELFFIEVTGETAHFFTIPENDEAGDAEHFMFRRHNGTGADVYSSESKAGVSLGQCVEEWRDSLAGGAPGRGEKEKKSCSRTYYQVFEVAVCNFSNHTASS